jgi:hypothetical protein
MNAIPPQSRPHQPHLLPFVIAEQLALQLFRLRERFGGVIRRLIDVGLAEIEDAGRKDDGHLDHMQAVVVVEKLRNMKAGEYCHIILK